jgi:DNA-directed RNA polymerase specialized sigma24 family protein
VKDSIANLQKENERLRLIQQFDQKAIGKFIRELVKHLKRYLTYKVQNPADKALDLAHQVVSVYHCRGPITLNCKLMTHSITIAKNLYSNEVQKVLDQQTDPEPPEFFYNLIAEDNIYETIEESEIRQGVHKCLQRLSEKCQKILRLYMEGASSGQAMKSMGFGSKGTYQVRKSECLDKFELEVRGSSELMELLS